MRILHVVPSYLPAVRYGGPIVSVHGLCKALARRGHEVHVFTTNVDGPRDSDVPLGVPVDLDGVKVWYFPSRRLRRLYWAPEMGRALEDQVPRFDVLHLHSVFLWPTTAAARTARRCGVPYVLAPRGMLVGDLIRRKSRWLKKAWITLFEQCNLDRAAAIHVTSVVEARDLEELCYRCAPIHIVPNGVDLHDATGEIGEHNVRVEDALSGGPYVVFLGRINWKKGLDRLIEALPGIPDAKVVIAGNDEENYTAELQKLATRRGVAGRISFVGPVYGNDKLELLRNASVLILPSYSENFGNVVLEAMIAGCPVVVTAEVGIASTVRETGCGLVVDGNPESLADGIGSLLRNPLLGKEMGARGMSAAAQRFSWDVAAEQMEKVYCEAVETHNKGKNNNMAAEAPHES